jgi:hypothetical protein
LQQTSVEFKQQLSLQVFPLGQYSQVPSLQYSSAAQQWPLHRTPLAQSLHEPSLAQAWSQHCPLQHSRPAQHLSPHAAPCLHSQRHVDGSNVWPRGHFVLRQRPRLGQNAIPCGA